MYDVIAGLGLAAMSVPQALAKTRVLSTPVGNGLYMALRPVLTFALFGRSRQLEASAYPASAALLADTELPVVDIALALGYAEASPFTRAFRRWSRHAPMQ